MQIEELDEARREEEEEQDQEEKRQRDAEYLDFRRRFDKMKQQQEGVQAESEKIKTQGNNFFKLGLYMQASMMYSEAIELQPDSAVLYCNRAMAYLKQDMPHEALVDAEKSLEIDTSVENIKAYWRQAQALLDLDRLEESEAAADAGIALQGGNQHLNRVRRKAREAATMRRLCGHPWSAKMPNGIEKRYTFESDGSMKINVFGHYVPATFDLSVEGNPWSMVVRMKPEGVGAGNGPPPPPRPYIFEFHDEDQELWLCTPVGTDELPTKFDGPGFDRLRAAAPEPTGDEASDEPLDARCERYIREMNEAMPQLPPQLPASPSEQEISQEALVMESISQLKRRFGMQVHQRALELAKDPASAPSSSLADLAEQLQRRFVSRRILAPPPPREEAAPAAGGEGGSEVAPRAGGSSAATEGEALQVVPSAPAPSSSTSAAAASTRPRSVLACFAGICGGSS